jgi:hypothetical protein
VAKKLTSCPEYRALCLVQIQHITDYNSSYFEAWWRLHHVMGMLAICRMQRNGIELSTGNILEENLVQSDFQKTLGEKFTFQQDNNLKHKAKYTLELLTKMTLNVPEWPSYSFDLNLLVNLWHDLNGCRAMINNQLDKA